MGRAMTMSTNPLVEVDEGSVTYVVPELPWEVVRALATPLLRRSRTPHGRSGGLKAHAGGRRPGTGALALWREVWTHRLRTGRAPDLFGQPSW